MTRKQLPAITSAIILASALSSTAVLAQHPFIPGVHHPLPKAKKDVAKAKKEKKDKDQDEPKAEAAAASAEKQQPEAEEAEEAPKQGWAGEAAIVFEKHPPEAGVETLQEGELQYDKVKGDKIVRYGNLFYEVQLPGKEVDEEGVTRILPTLRLRFVGATEQVKGDAPDADSLEVASKRLGTVMYLRGEGFNHQITIIPYGRSFGGEKALNEKTALLGSVGFDAPGFTLGRPENTELGTYTGVAGRVAAMAALERQIGKGFTLVFEVNQETLGTARITGNAAMPRFFTQSETEGAIGLEREGSPDDKGFLKVMNHLTLEAIVGKRYTTGLSVDQGFETRENIVGGGVGFRWSAQKPYVPSKEDQEALDEAAHPGFSKPIKRH